jgi:hypothetical protein
MSISVLKEGEEVAWVAGKSFVADAVTRAIVG